jgi:hypothetical protein
LLTLRRPPNLGRATRCGVASHGPNRVRPRLQPLPGGRQRANRVRGADVGIGGDACRRLEVDHGAAGVRATARENLLLLLIDVPVPHLEELAGPRVIDVWEQCSEAASDPAGLIDHDPENVEDDHVGVVV